MKPKPGHAGGKQAQGLPPDAEKRRCIRMKKAEDLEKKANLKLANIVVVFASIYLLYLMFIINDIRLDLKNVLFFMALIFFCAFALSSLKKDEDELRKLGILKAQTKRSISRPKRHSLREMFLLWIAATITGGFSFIIIEEEREKIFSLYIAVSVIILLIVILEFFLILRGKRRQT